MLYAVIGPIISLVAAAINYPSVSPVVILLIIYIFSILVYINKAKEEKASNNTNNRTEKPNNLYWAIAFLFILIIIILLIRNWNVVDDRDPEQTPSTLGAPTAAPSSIIPTISEIITPSVQVESPSPVPTNASIPTEIPIPPLTSTPSPKLTPRGSYYCITLKTSGVNVRINPNDQSKHLGNLSFDDCLYFSDISSDGAWVRIALIQPEEFSSVAGGWVKSDFLNPPNFDRLPEFSRANDFPNDFLCVNVINVHVREEPSIDSLPFPKAILFDECLKFDGKNEDGSWVRISLDEEKYSSYSHGWIRSDLLIPKWRIDNLPIVTPDPTPQG